jgi:hypothetical protein
MSALAAAAVTIAGAALVGAGASQWRRRVALTQRSEQWFGPSDHRWRRVNTTRIRAGALLLFLLGTMLFFAGIVNLLGSL